LETLKPEDVEVEFIWAAEMEKPEIAESEVDEMWSFVAKKDNQRWLWDALDRRSGQVLADVFGRRKDEVFLELKKLLLPLGIQKYCTEGWGAS